MPFANHDGDQIHYEVYGSGPPLIIQHGLYSSSEELSYPQFVEAVSESFQMIFVDSLGHGLSDKPMEKERYAPVHRAGAIAAVLDDLGHKSAHYFGYSMGGWIGCAVAKHAPERLKSLCIAGWPVEITFPGDVAAEGFEEYWAKSKRALFFDNPRAFGRITKETEPALQNCFRATRDNAGFIEAVKQLTVPTLILCGEEDQLFEGAKSAAEQIGTRFMAVPGNHGQAINQNLGFYFPEVAEFFLNAEG
jgi:pimeloyl-ACP methyl ester carboxylesterase